MFRRENVPSPIDPSDPAKLVEAVVLWTGYGRTASPHRIDSILIQRFGPEIGNELLAAVKLLEDQFYRSDARFAASNLHEMGKMCAEQFRNTNPGVAEEVVRAFAWCYTFDFK